MQEITIQKWIDFYRNKKSMTKFISLIKKEDLMLLSFTPENLIIEENLPEFGILEEDVKNILYEDVRLNNKLMFLKEEHEINNSMDKINANIKNKAERVLIDEKDDRENNGVFSIIMEKIESLKNNSLSEEEKKQEEELKKITSSKKILEIEQKIREDLEKEKELLEKTLTVTKNNFYRELVNSKTRLVLAMYHGVDVDSWRDKYGQEFEQVVWTSVVQGEYELYGYDYPDVIKKLIERKIVLSRDLIDYSLPRGEVEGERYPIDEINLDLKKHESETDEEFKKRRKELEKEAYNKELKRIKSEINRKVTINKIKILFGI